jgi:anaerobic selenocysteine-containing dehydrogenase
MPAMLDLRADGSPAQSTPVTPASATEGSIRLVTRRTLWDGGTLVQAVPHLSGLHPAARFTVNPSVLADLGAADGEVVRAVSSRGVLALPAEVDVRMPPGIALLAWDLPDGRAGDLIDVEQPFTEVRLELPPPVEAMGEVDSDGAEGGELHG